MTKEEIFKKEEEFNQTSTQVGRFCGWFCMCFGIWLLFSPIIAALAWIPLVGYLLSTGVSIVVIVFALVLSATLSLLTIALAWLYYRPLFGLLLLTGVAAGVAIMFLV